MRAPITLTLALGLSACSVSDDDLWGARCTLAKGSCGAGSLTCSPVTLRCVNSTAVPSGGGGGAGGGNGGGLSGGGMGGGSGGGGCSIQPFATVDDWLPTGCSAANGRFVSVISSPSPQVIVAGNLKCIGQGIAVRSLGSDGGWATLYDGQDGGPWTNPTLSGMTIIQGQIFLVGSDPDPDDGGVPTKGWRVWRKGLGATDPMELVDSSPNGKATAVTSSPTSGVVVAGVRDGRLAVRRWAGANWADAFVDLSPTECRADPSGIAIDTAGNTHLTGRRVSDGGCDVERPWFTMTLTNFATVWDGGFVQQAGTEATGEGLAAQANGDELFTIGRTRVPAAEWLVRRSFDRGQTWEGSERWQLDPAQSCTPVGVTATGNRTWVAGTCTDGSGVRNWAVRSMEASVWSTADLWSPGVAATASSVAIDARETVYVVGSTDNGRWIVRSARCQ